ncbi:MAG: hypothetical protein Q8P41_21990 [Pseudomonadota bacterium]|nr:hypothetical protein [Pseudomonadota bacterium]
MVTLLLALACAPVVEDPGAPPAATMAPLDVLVRTSLDVRGVRPSEEEYAALEADPGALDGLVAGYLQDPRFGSRVGDLWAELYLTRSDSYTVNAAAYDRDDEHAFVAAVGDEPLRVLGYAADHDLPWTEIVTGDWTMANEVLGAVWPVEYPEGSTGWVKSRYTDGRPAAGVLAGNALWWRYTSTDSNANRKRANIVSRLFLCNDYLTRPLEFDRSVNLLDEAAVADALLNDPGCVNCHHTLDPLASYLFGFWWFDYYDGVELRGYHPERERLWQDYTFVAPAYFGEPGSSLADLGQQIAADERFPTCAVEQAWQLLLRREATLADTDALVRHRDAFLAGGVTMRALFASILSDPAYRAAADTTGGVPARLVTPAVLASEIEDLTGYRWTVAGGYDALGVDAAGLEDKGDLLVAEAVGFRTLAGAADGYNVTRSATTPNATLVLVHERLAEAAAWYTVHTLPERLFAGLAFTETPETDPGAMISAIQALHWRLYGARVTAEGDEVTAALELWADLYAITRDPRAAWAGLLSALLRDPRLLVY